MNTPLRLSLYGLGLVAVFGVAFAAAGALVPTSVIEARAAATEGAHDAHNAAAAEDEGAGEAALPGLSMSQGGYQLSEVTAPMEPGEEGELSFSIRDADGTALTEYTEEHEKDLHLIVVRTDGSEFRHVHPEIDGDGTWSLPWSWTEAGAYRVFADFTPGDAESGITLTSTLNIGGDFTPVPASGDVREAKTGDYVVTLTGELPVGGSSTLSLDVSKDGSKVTALEPYLGAFGHLVALRDGDLAYLHVHPEGAEPEAGQLSGPTVDFATEAPTTGRYLLYFDFKIDGEVHTAEFVLNTEGNPAGTTTDDAQPTESTDAPGTDDSSTDTSNTEESDGHDDGESGH